MTNQSRAKRAYLFIFKYFIEKYKKTSGHFSKKFTQNNRL
ncbi:hypothetical protein X781_11500 [Mannheimia sp. USDA-ARS-USMARC-1261]|nr:hypothetical protein X781_11500 [Mannheimia sp. USDA-ARS-USMARC-1261]